MTALDIAARLADGKSALAHTEAYVSACRALGYHYPEINSYAGQLGEWFAAEEWLDLAKLEADCSKLVASARATEEALDVERKAIDALATAWTGEAGQEASAHTRRHCLEGEAVLNGLRTAADSLRVLREKLWRAVDDKVNATVTIDNRTASQRGHWLVAAATVIGGGPDRATFADVVEREIKPYVERDIRVEWVAAMQSTTADAHAAYGEAVSRLTDHKAIRFALPRLGSIPRAVPPVARRVQQEEVAKPALPRMPAEQQGPIAWPQSGLAGPSPAMASQPPPLADPLPAGLLGGLPAGEPLGGTGFEGLVSQIVDTVAGLLDQPTDSLDDQPLRDALPDDEPDLPEHEDSESDQESEPKDKELLEEPVVADAEQEVASDQVSPMHLATPEAAVPDSNRELVPEPTSASAVSDSQESGVQKDQTPCEIAFNELPQVGQ